MDRELAAPPLARSSKQIYDRRWVGLRKQKAALNAETYRKTAAQAFETTNDSIDPGPQTTTLQLQ